MDEARLEVGVDDGEAPTARSERSAGEMGVLRDLLFGEQRREFEGRFDALEARMRDESTELRQTLDRKIGELASSTGGATEALEASLTSRIDHQERSQREALEVQAERSAAQLGQLQSELNARLEQLQSELSAQLRETQEQFASRLDQMGRELAARLDSLERESREREQALRDEMHRTTTSLDDQKASRRDLGNMLAEIGRQLAAELHPDES